MSEKYTWDTDGGAGGGNSIAPPDGAPEGMDYRAINNVTREIMAAEARDLADRNGSVLLTGSSGTYTATVFRSLGGGALPGFIRLTFRAPDDYVGAATLAIQDSDAATYGPNPLTLAQGGDVDLVAGGIYDAYFDGTGWRIISNAVPVRSFEAPTSEIASRAFTADDNGRNLRVTNTSGIVLELTGGGLGGGGRKVNLLDPNGYGLTLLNNTAGAIFTTWSSGIPSGGADALAGRAGYLLQLDASNFLAVAYA